MTDEDALGIAKRLKYEYVPKGQALRRAFDNSNRLCHLMIGKVVCAFPNEDVVEK